MTTFPFPTDTGQTAASISFRNKRLIADDVLPRRAVGTIKFRYFKHDKAETFAVPDTKVGRKSRPNEFSFTATEVLDQTLDYGLEDPIPNDDVRNAPAEFNPVTNSTLNLTSMILLDREQRCAGIVFDPAQYPAANKVTLAGTSQWSDFAVSDPIGDIMAGIDALIFRPNVMVLGRAVFSTLAQHPKIVKAAHGNSGDSGVATREQIARLFEFDKVAVGEGFLNIAKKGQPANLQRVWGKHCSLLFSDDTGVVDMPTFGFTAQYLSRLAGQVEDKNIGLRGGVRVRVGESVKEVVSASDLGYFIENAVA